MQHLSGPRWSIQAKGLMGDNLLISRGMPEISSFNDSDFLAEGATIWIRYLAVRWAAPTVLSAGCRLCRLPDDDKDISLCASGRDGQSR